MKTSSVKLILDLSFGVCVTQPNIVVCLDNDIVLQGPQQQPVSITIDQPMALGSHRLSVEFTNKNYNEPLDMFVQIDRLKFQHLPDNFATYSQYQPIYPELWAQEQLAQGCTLKNIIHSNHLGWNGTWWVDFDTPIYCWLHQRLNLGWLLT
jgi:hypothetical protein